MLGYLRLWREHETRRIDAAGARLIAEVARCRLARSEQPQYAAFDLAQEAHPHVEELRRELVAVVEAAEHESGLGQTDGAAGRSLGCDLTLGIIDLIAIWQVDDHLAVRLLLIERQNDPIRQYIVDEIHPHCCGISEVARLHRRRAVSENRRPPVLGMAFQVDGDVDIEVEQQLRRFAVAAQRHVVELIERRDQAPARLTAVVYAIGHAEHLESGPVVQLEQLGRKPGRSMVAEIRREIGEPDLLSNARLMSPREPWHRR